MKKLNEKINLSDKLRMYRAKNRLTQKELAEKSGLSTATIYGTENNQERRLELESILRLSDALDISLEELIVEKF